MEESNIWVIGVVALAVGALIGYLMGRSGNAGNDQQQALDDARKELEDYKSKVAGHFEETAEMVNQMTESYRGVYQKLATGAQTLCDAETARSIESSMVPQLTVQKEVEAQEVSETTEAVNEEPSVEPPRDYAPKKPDEEGTLSESYGITEEKAETEAEETTADESSEQKEANSKP